MKEYEFHPIANIFPLMTPEEMSELTVDIKTNGLKQSIVLYEDKILDGRNRYQACVSASVDPKFTQYKGNTPYSDAMSLNIQRRHLTAGQKACLAIELLPSIISERKRKNVSVSKFETGMDIRSEQKAAKLVGTNQQSMNAVKQIKKERPEIYEKIKNGQYSIEDGKRNVKKIEVKAKLDVIASTSPQTPTGKFQVIVIDPPWPMQKIERDVATEQVLFDYPVMTIDKIKELSPVIHNFADDDTHLFLWTTEKFLPISFDILSTWGAKYVFTMVWHKNGGFQPYNLPQYNCEFCLYGKIGNPQFITTKNFNTCFSANRTDHSEKPQEFYDLLNRITGGRRLDFFNRRKIEGFIGWGNEAK